MDKVIKVLILLALAIGIGVAVTKMLETKERFMAMTEAEQREFIANKIGDKVPEERLTEIQDGIVNAVSGKKGESPVTD